MGPRRQPLRPRGMQLLWSESSLIFPVEYICQSKMEMGHYLRTLTVWFPQVPQGAQCSICCSWGPLLGHCHEHIQPYMCKQTFSAEGLEQLLLLNIWTYTYKLLNTLFQNYSVFHILSLKNHLSAHGFQTSVSPVCQSGTQPCTSTNNSSPSLLSHADGCSSSDGGLNFGGSRNSSIHPSAGDGQRKFSRV